MAAPLLQFVSVGGEVGIAVHSAAALAWLLKNPPPAMIPVYLSRVVVKELNEEAKMPTSKSGEKFHSFGRAKLQDDMDEERKAKTPAKAGPKSMEAPKKESKGEAAPKAAKEPEGGKANDHDADDMETMPDTPTSIEEHVSAHGPSDHTIHKMGADGMHHTLSHHGGMKHKATHSTPEEAHMHLGKAMGAQAMGDGGGLSPAAPQPAATGGIPGMM